MRLRVFAHLTQRLQRISLQHFLFFRFDLLEDARDQQRQRFFQLLVLFRLGGSKNDRFSAQVKADRLPCPAHPVCCQALS